MNIFCKFYFISSDNKAKCYPDYALYLEKKTNVNLK